MGPDDIGRPERLQLYFDGELPQSEAEALRFELGPELEGRVRELREISSMVVEAATEGAGEVPSDAMWATIQAALPAEPAAERPRLRAVQGGREPRARSSRGSLLWIPFAGALAAAAAVLLTLLEPEPSSHAEREGLAIDAGASLAPAPGSIIAGSEVVEVDFGLSSGTVFSVEDREDGVQYAVLWISDAKVLDTP